MVNNTISCVLGSIVFPVVTAGQCSTVRIAAHSFNTMPKTDDDPYDTAFLMLCYPFPDRQRYLFFHAWVTTYIIGDKVYCRYSDYDAMTWH